MKSKMILQLDHITINLIKESQAIRFKSELDNLLFENQTYNEVTNILTMNYKTVKGYFETRTSEIVSMADLENLSLKIVVHFFYMYNMWRSMYKRESNRSLIFLEKDFDQPLTSQLIIQYFKHNIHIIMPKNVR